MEHTCSKWPRDLESAWRRQRWRPGCSCHLFHLTCDKLLARCKKPLKQTRGYTDLLQDSYALCVTHWRYIHRSKVYFVSYKLKRKITEREYVFYRGFVNSSLAPQIPFVRIMLYKAPYTADEEAASRGIQTVWRLNPSICFLRSSWRRGNYKTDFNINRKFSESGKFWLCTCSKFY